MTDVLLSLGSNPRARTLFRTLGLPVPLPATLRRARGPVTDRELADKKVLFTALGDAPLASMCASALARAGADCYLDDFEPLRERFRGPCEAYGRGPHALALLNESTKLDAIVLDISSARAVGDLRVLYSSLRATVTRLRTSGRVVVLASSAAEGDEEQRAVQQAIDGFVRSLAKELGRTGSTANLVRVKDDSVSRAGAVLSWLLSERSAFVTGQCLEVSCVARAAGTNTGTHNRVLEGKTALVTGAARGIGAATARALARDGAYVVCVDRSDDGALSALARELSGRALALDIAAENAGESLRALFAERPLDVIVHNAGITRDKTLARMTDAHWDDVLAVNLQSIVETTRALEPVLREGGRVIALSSVAGIAGNTGQCAYAASKAGVIGWTRASSARLASKAITVNAIAPGFIETKMTESMPIAIREAARRLSALAQGGRPEDVAEAIAFFASPAAQGLTGQTLRVCGGALIGA